MDGGDGCWGQLVAMKGTVPRAMEESWVVMAEVVVEAETVGAAGKVAAAETPVVQGVKREDWVGWAEARAVRAVRAVSLDGDQNGPRSAKCFTIAHGQHMSHAIAPEVVTLVTRLCSSPSKQACCPPRPTCSPRQSASLCPHAP